MIVASEKFSASLDAGGGKKAEKILEILPGSRP
jgi:hypothetical protein